LHNVKNKDCINVKKSQNTSQMANTFTAKLIFGRNSDPV